MDKYAIDRLNEELESAIDKGIMPQSAARPAQLHLERRSRELVPQTEAKEILEDIEELQCDVDELPTHADNIEPIQQQLASLWCRVDELKGMVTVNG